MPSEELHAADLYQWLGDGGQRDYSSWVGRKVWLYNVNTKKKQSAGVVKFWKKAADADQEAGKKNLVGTDVWNADFSGAVPGRYRLVVEDVGCSMDFDIAADVYYQPFRYAVRGYYYMRLGEPKDPDHVWPVPRQPQFIPETDPKGLTVYKTDFHPFMKEWTDLHTDVWDEPHFKPAMASRFWQHRLPGNPVNVDVRGGHSDAFDWDRHIAHVSNIYDMLLPYILSGGRLSDDNLGIRESGNGIPDIRLHHDGRLGQCRQLRHHRRGLPSDAERQVEDRQHGRFAQALLHRRGHQGLPLCRQTGMDAARRPAGHWLDADARPRLP